MSMPKGALGHQPRALPYAPHLLHSSLSPGSPCWLHAVPTHQQIPRHKKNSKAVMPAFSLARGCISWTMKSFPISLLLTTNTIPKCSIFNIYMPTQPPHVSNLTEKFLYVCKGAFPARSHSLFFPTSKAVIFVYYEDSHLILSTAQRFGSAKVITVRATSLVTYSLQGYKRHTSCRELPARSRERLRYSFFQYMKPE